MYSISYNILISFITLAVFIAIIIIAIFIKPGELQKSRAFVFASILASVAVGILGLNVCLSTVRLNFQQNINKAQFTKQNVDKLWIYPNQVLAEKAQARPEFLASLYYNNLTLYKLTKNTKTKPTVASELEEQYIAILLFQCWEDYLTARRFNGAGDEIWLVNFLQWAQSPYLKEEFDRLKHNFAALTIRFGELLFEYGKKLPVPTRDPQLYQNLAKELLKNPALQKIYKERAEL